MRRLQRPAVCSPQQDGAGGEEAALSGCLFSQLELLECGRAQVLEQCARCIQGGWRRHRHREQARQRRAAMLIQAGRWAGHLSALHTDSTGCWFPLKHGSSSPHLLKLCPSLKRWMARPCGVLGFRFPIPLTHNVSPVQWKPSHSINKGTLEEVEAKRRL